MAVAENASSTEDQDEGQHTHSHHSYDIIVFLSFS